MDPQNQQMPVMPDTQKKPIGPIIGLIVILALILLGGIYFYSTSTYPALDENINTESTGDLEEEPVDNAAIESQSSSDDVTSIEADLEATNLDSLDGDFNEIQ